MIIDLKIELIIIIIIIVTGDQKSSAQNLKLKKNIFYSSKFFEIIHSGSKFYALFETEVCFLKKSKLWHVCQVSLTFSMVTKNPRGFLYQIYMFYIFSESLLDAD